MPKKRRAPVVITIIFVVLLIVVGAVVYASHNKSSDDKTAAKTDKPSLASLISSCHAMTTDFKTADGKQTFTIVGPNSDKTCKVTETQPNNQLITCNLKDKSQQVNITAYVASQMGGNEPGQSVKDAIGGYISDGICAITDIASS